MFSLRVIRNSLNFLSSTLFNFINSPRIQHIYTHTKWKWRNKAVTFRNYNIDLDILSRVDKHTQNFIAVLRTRSIINEFSTRSSSDRRWTVGSYSRANCKTKYISYDSVLYSESSRSAWLTNTDKKVVLREFSDRNLCSCSRIRLSSRQKETTYID